MKNLVIGFDGLTGTGKTTVSQILCNNHSNFIRIELGDIYRNIVPIWIELKKTFPIDYITKYICETNIKYIIKNNTIIYENDKKISKKNYSKAFVRNEIYNMVQVEEINKKIYSTLKDIINELRKKYKVIIVGRELDIIYPDMDYHFYFKADECDRFSRIILRDKISEKEAKDRKIEEKITKFSSNVITINSSRLSAEDIANLVKNVIIFRKSITKMKIRFVGAPSTGKTTTSKLCSKNFNGIYAVEKLRIYMENNKMSFKDLSSWNYDKWYEIMYSQIESEKNFENCDAKYLFADSSALLYALDFDLLDSSKIQKIVQEQLNDTDILFVCDNDIPYVKDDLRPDESELNLEECENKIISYLNQNNIPYFILTGSIDERMKTIEQIIK